MANFRIGIEQSQSRVCRRDAGRSQDISRPHEIPSVVAEQELAVLIVRASRASLHVNLIVVVFTGILIQTAELESVVAFDPGKAVGDVVDGSRGMRGIWPAAQSGESRHVTVGMRLGISFPVGKMYG